MSFGEALEIIKRGGKVRRLGWNGKEQYICLAINISYETYWNPRINNECKHKDIGSQAILFVGTRGSQIGWLASQADMLAEDWVEVNG